MSDDVLVRVVNVSKRFCRSLKRSLWYGLQDLGSEIGGGRHGGGSGLPQSSADVPLRPDEFWAVKDVSFELRRGECLGLIGRNGAGKTTLLRMLNGLIKPDTGHIEMKGRVGALIALGAGFNPLLTGKENIYTNASVLGISKSETEAYIEKIVEFSELEDFIDTPVQSYSSGMQVRLGFAIAAILIKPEILLLDEVLAVGDASFQIKCINMVKKLLNSGTASIFVSHNPHDLSRYCTLGLYLDGTINSIGPLREVLGLYQLKSIARQKNVSKELEVITSIDGSKISSIRVQTNSTNDPLKQILVIEAIADVIPSRNQGVFEILVEADETRLLCYKTKVINFTKKHEPHILRLSWDTINLRTCNISVGVVLWDEKSENVISWSKTNTAVHRTHGHTSLLMNEPSEVEVA